ncbi:xanthine dehydrogenase YagT iron-sulfur-binding subunit [Kibdelosporangium banguiense]|uniref:Xanthine dehydrogenase YagT iron-sulfur-binding subunit n=1 Tax=Kibdelosporangium banguiense TaxID=1365924 RepID=A0ABS4TNF8_9PSEU|nr:2Fe-2S iron-sulfur cluster-binding protein [Kibdelosporangium banguiense]MBP2325942.1 xanthine dehydrogenase YagT iron-sulfur-binding subunit [Kibdelosporangium banguiense]
MVEVTMHVNGTITRLDIPPQVSLLDALREHLGLPGPKKGCDQGACGACTVLADGERINSCLGLAVQYTGREIITIEGIADPIQAAFIRNDGFQCGFCTSGQICSAVGMLAEHKEGAPSAVTEDTADTELSEEEIRERMSGNLCRCGAYNGIVSAIQEVAAQQEQEEAAP